MALTIVPDDPAAQIAEIAVKNLAVMHLLIERLHVIALMEESCPAAAALAVQTLRDVTSEILPIAVGV